MASPVRSYQQDHTCNLPSTCQYTAQNIKLRLHRSADSPAYNNRIQKYKCSTPWKPQSHIDNPEDPDADQLIATLEAFGLEQHIKFPTHQLGHTLDLIATEPATKLTCTPIPGPYL